MTKRLHQRVAVLIDTQNMYHSAKHIHGARLAFGKLAEALAHGRPIVRVLAYVAKSKTGEEAAFFEALLEAGIELRVKDVQEFSSGEKKADWDVGMAVDAIKLAPKVDAIILVTGDGDFVPLVEYLKAHGNIVEVAAFAESTNATLKVVCDNFYDISTQGHEFLMGARTRRPAIATPRLLDMPAKTIADKKDVEAVELDASGAEESTEEAPAKKGRGRAAGGSSPRIRVTF